MFKAGGVYRMDSALRFSHRHNLTFEGNGATLKANGGTSEASSLVWIGGGSGIIVRDFKLVGNSPTPGVYEGGREGAHGILVDGASNVQVSNVTVSGVWGDCFYVGSWADTVWIHDSTCQSSGRNGVTITAGRNVTVERVAFPKSGYCTFDAEPNVSTEGATNVIFRSNTAGTFGLDFAAVEGSHTGAAINGITISGNTITGGTLYTVIDNGGTSRMRNIVFTDNKSTVAGHGPVLIFAHIDGLTVTGNVQPLIGAAHAHHRQHWRDRRLNRRSRGRSACSRGRRAGRDRDLRGRSGPLCAGGSRQANRLIEPEIADELSGAEAGDVADRASDQGLHAQRRRIGSPSLNVTTTKGEGGDQKPCGSGH